MTLTINNADRSASLTSFVLSFIFHGEQNGIDLVFSQGVSNDDRQTILETLDTFKNKLITLNGDNKVSVSLKLLNVFYNTTTQRITLIGENFSWN